MLRIAQNQFIVSNIRYLWDRHQSIMDRKRYIAIDLETTGFSPLRGDRVIEVGAVHLQNQKICGEFHSLINIGRRIPRSATAVHGITHKMLIGWPNPEEVFHKFYSFIAGGVLVAHNASFDISFLRHEFGRLGLELSNKYQCTLEMSRRLFPQLRNHTLESVYRHLFGHSINAIQEHRALSDARMTTEIWMEMLHL